MDGYTEITIFLWGPKISDGNKPPKNYTHQQMAYPHILSSSTFLEFHYFIFHCPNFIFLHFQIGWRGIPSQICLPWPSRYTCMRENNYNVPWSTADVWSTSFFWGEGFYRIFVGRWLQGFGAGSCYKCMYTTYRNRPVYAYTHTCIVFNYVFLHVVLWVFMTENCTSRRIHLKFLQLQTSQCGWRAQK